MNNFKARVWEYFLSDTKATKSEMLDCAIRKFRQRMEIYLATREKKGEVIYGNK